MYASLPAFVHYGNNRILIDGASGSSCACCGSIVRYGTLLRNRNGFSDIIVKDGEQDHEMDRFSVLMAKAQDGDQQAYTELLQALVPLIRGFVRHHYPGIRDVEDAAQDSLVTLHRVRHTYDPVRPFMPWLYAIVRHRCLDHLRKVVRVQSREIQEETMVNLAPTPDPRNELEGVEVAEQMLASLGERERQVIRLLKIEQISVKDVAERLNLSESNVKVIASRGYTTLRQAWKDRHEH